LIERSLVFSVPVRNGAVATHIKKTPALAYRSYKTLRIAKFLVHTKVEILATNGNFPDKIFRKFRKFVDA